MLIIIYNALDAKPNMKCCFHSAFVWDLQELITIVQAHFAIIRLLFDGSLVLVLVDIKHLSFTSYLC